jgi:hypothetical protein
MTLHREQYEQETPGYLHAGGMLLAWTAAKLPSADAKAQQQRKILTDSITSGTPPPVTINVADNANVEAVMLQRAITKRVFGKDVANNHAVTEVNISNRSNDAALILQSLFVDTTERR